MLKHQHILPNGSMVALPPVNDTPSRGWFLFDIESTGLIDSSTIDYTQSPYKPKPNLQIHCAVFIDCHTEEVFVFDGNNLTGVSDFIQQHVRVVVGHNIIDYDLLLCKILLGVPFTVAGDVGESDTWAGVPVQIIDTLIFAKVLNPDRYTGYGLDALTKEFDLNKIHWREYAIELGYILKTSPDGAEFAVYSQEMLEYCIRDCQVNGLLLTKLQTEAVGWDWVSAHQLEKAVREIVTRQSHRGFLFGYEAALGFVRDLDEKLNTRRELVEPLIPPKPLTKGKLDAVTPPVRQLLYSKVPQPPKIQFKKDGSLSATMLSFAAKLGAEITQDCIVINDTHFVFTPSFPLTLEDISTAVPVDSTPTTNIESFVQKHNGTLYAIEEKWFCELYGESYQLPLPLQPLHTIEPAKISDTTHLKGWLIDLGWEPSDWKEKDLSTVKKVKLPPDKYAATAQRYIDQTLSSPFYGHRLAFLGIHHKDKTKRDALFAAHLLNHTGKYGMKVITNPILTVGQSKEIDPALLALTDKFPYAKEVSEYLTYQHRRNSILGGNVDPDDEDEEINKGFLAVDRIYQDGRIPTPADTCGCNTTRFKHRVVANIPRSSSLYGKQMRSLFGVDPGEYLLLGYDFMSLEARIEAHYTYKYDDADHSYSTSLLGEQPNDVHTLTAVMISEIIQRPFTRQDAKSVKYACFNPDTTFVKTVDGYKEFKALVPTDLLYAFDSETYTTVVTPLIGIYQVQDTIWELKLDDTFIFHCTENHNWLTYRGYVETQDLLTDDYIFTSHRRIISCANMCLSVVGFMDVACVHTLYDNFVVYSTISETESITGNCTYGASAKKISKTIGSDDETGKKVFDGFWLAAAPLAALKVKLESYWEKIGNKRFVLGLDGRKIPTRSKSALINALFQSAGIICAKRAMVIHDRLLAQHGLVCDFWVDDWKTKTFVQQLGHFHDEAQIEFSKSLVQYKLFPVTEWQTNKKGKPESLATLDQIYQYRQSNPYWSSTKQTAEGYVIGYSIVGELAMKAVQMAGEYYNLNVPLAADYAIGVSWDETH